MADGTRRAALSNLIARSMIFVAASISLRLNADNRDTENRER
jgi:hypothetical protein